MHRRPPPARDHRQLRAACTGSTGRMLAAERAGHGRPECSFDLCVMPIYFPQHDTQVSPRRGCRTRYGRVYPFHFVLACRVLVLLCTFQRVLVVCCPARACIVHISLSYRIPCLSVLSLSVKSCTSTNMRDVAGRRISHQVLEHVWRVTHESVSRGRGGSRPSASRASRRSVRTISSEVYLRSA